MFFGLYGKWLQGYQGNSIEIQEEMYVLLLELNNNEFNRSERRIEPIHPYSSASFEKQI